MGTVFLAERDDDQFEKRVAVKIIAAGVQTPDLLGRFRSERQILAQLEHPNIARLLDSGITPDGFAFIVMEYVEGTPITDFCRSLPLEARLDLFESACLAVHFAHQHLVVHRDIKPGNLLVTAAGVPKLLDFGIAKILDSSGDSFDGTTGATTTLFRPLTPEYASPEQLAGGTVSTASDIYSLGILLFELLAGERPYRAGDKRDDELRIPPRIPHDLGCILRKAMRREPGGRYPSAHELAADIDRYLVRKPVLARRGTLRYTIRKFVERHRPGVAACLTAACLLLAAVLALFHSWRVADAERATAQERFAQLRNLANSLVFEIHDGIAALPGSTPIRRTLVARALEYLDTLEKGSSADLGLEFELSKAYQRLGTVQGNPSYNNLGDIPEALRSYAHAGGLLHRILAESPGRRDVLQELAWLQLRTANVHNYLRKVKERDAELAQALKISQQLSEPSSNNEPAMELRAAVLSDLADARAEHDGAAGRELYRQALSIYQELLQAHPSDPDRQRRVALIHKYLANLIRSDREALDHLRQAEDLDRARVAVQPTSSLAQLDLSFDMSDIGWRLERAGDLSGALQSYRRVVAVRQALATADPNNSWVRSRLIYIRRNVANLLTKMGRLREARTEYRSASELAQAAISAAPADRWNRGYLADLQLGYAAVEAKLGRRDEACKAYGRASDLLARLITEGAALPEERDKAATATKAVAACETQ
jgi:non-specific serine/threonine protein kinase/serine/threonine-protein kinase